MIGLGKAKVEVLTWGQSDLAGDTIYKKYAKEVTVSIDKFDSKTTWSTGGDADYTNVQSKGEAVSFYKVKEKKEDFTNTYLSLKTNSSTLLVLKKGVIILFTDGEKIEFPREEIDVKAIDEGWQYSAFIRIDEEDLDKLINKSIDSFRLYIFDGSVYGERRRQIRGWAEGIKEAN